MYELLEILHPFTRAGHILFGAIGLFLFWLPMFTAKGQRKHRIFGRIFEAIAWVVIFFAGYGTISYLARFWLSGMGLQNHLREFSLIIMLGGLTLTATTMLYQGRAALRWSYTRLSNFYAALHLTLLLASISIIAFTAIVKPHSSIVMYVTAVFGLLVVIDGIQFRKVKNVKKEDWLLVHLNGMMGTGVAFYVAFGVFGSQYFFQTDSDAAGWRNALPWVMPIIIFIPMMIYWKIKIRTMFVRRSK
jgi:hypothetical protein